MSLYDQIQKAVEVIRARTELAPKVGVILGSGLGGFADSLTAKTIVPYGELPGFPTSSVPGHAGRLVVGMLDGAPIVAMQGRVHMYEGYSPSQVAFPARVLCALGIESLVVTNAAGGIRADLEPGDLMMITDHINLSGANPLVGPNDERLGPRFPDMSAAYDPQLCALLRKTAEKLGIPLKDGVYVWLSGPSYETPAEIRMLRTLGVDAVGMSTVPEVIVASHMRVRVAGISCITNFAAGIGKEPLSHEEVAETAGRVRDRFAGLLASFLPAVAQTPRK
ncbi:MAG: purine-nucleoside phosphorylase [Myxococcales bacterium]|jgi:purine-nucleoside phosphorylase